MLGLESRELLLAQMKKKVFEGDHMSHEWTFELKRGRLEGRAFLDVVAFSISNQGDIGGCSAQWVAPTKLILK